MFSLPTIRFEILNTDKRILTEVRWDNETFRSDRYAAMFPIGAFVTRCKVDTAASGSLNDPCVPIRYWFLTVISVFSASSYNQSFAASRGLENAIRKRFFYACNRVYFHVTIFIALLLSSFRIRFCCFVLVYFFPLFIQLLPAIYFFIKFSRLILLLSRFCSELSLQKRSSYPFDRSFRP